MTTLLLCLLLSACKLRPTFPADQIASSLRQMCAKDYRLSVETRHADKTLQAHVWKIGLFKDGAGDLQGLSQESMKSLQDVLLCATRVALSTDAKLDFIEVTFADVLSGTSMTIWRYVPDIKDSMLQRIGDTEYFSRLVIDISVQKANGASRKDREKVVLGETRWTEPITFSEFLAKQIIMRARRDGAEGLMAHVDLSEPTTLGVVVENWSSLNEESPEDAARIANLVRTAAQKVVKGYRFKGFRDLVLQDNRGVALHRWAF